MEKKAFHIIQKGIGHSFLLLLILCVSGCENILLAQGKSKAEDAKDTIQVVGHAHMDMNWLWTYSETMQMCNDNLRQTVAFMKEFPDYTMVQSQAAVFNFVEKVDPPLFELVKKYVKEGRLEPVGGMWTEGDENLSSGEAIVRSFLLGQRYFKSRFGRMAKVGWLPDNFGHTSQMPQILKLAGCDYFYFHRCKPYPGTFWWVAPDSSKVLCYANDTYNGNITPELKNEINKFSPDKRRILQITGIGDHGGGPTRANIEMVHQLDKKPGYPAVCFSTAENFFKRASREMEGRPIHFGEMQYIFEGCYTNVSDIKEGNRSCENMLYGSEFFNALRWLNGEGYPSSELGKIWQSVTFNQFHDILPGSAINESNKESIARYSEALREATELRNSAFRKIADEIKFQKGKGQPIVAFNLQPKRTKAIVEALVYSNEKPATANLVSWSDFYGSNKIIPVDKGQGAVPTVLVRDASGKIYPAQIIWGKSTPPGYTSKVQFVVNDMPACGYRTFYVDMNKPGEYNSQIPFKDNTFDTEFFRIKFDMKTGGIISLFDKRSNKEYVKEGGQLNKLKIYSEDRKGGMKSWTINKIVKVEDVIDVKSVKVVEDGPVRACVETVKAWGKSRFTERTYLYRSYPRIDYDMEVKWLETGSDSTDSPMLRAQFPLAVTNPRFYSQVPFDVVERPADGKINGKEAPLWEKSQSKIYNVNPETNDSQEVPAQKWVDITDSKNGIALLNRSKYGHSFHKGELRITLMRTAGSPDIYPNLGKFNISYSLFPHEGDWKNGVWQEGDDFNIPVYAAEPPSLSFRKNNAARPEEDSFIDVSSNNVVLTGIKKAEEKEELVVRLIETEGRETTAEVKLPIKISSAERLSLIEDPLESASAPIVSGRSVSIKLKPHEIVTLGIK